MTKDVLAPIPITFDTLNEIHSLIDTVQMVITMLEIGKDMEYPIDKLSGILDTMQPTVKKLSGWEKMMTELGEDI